MASRHSARQVVVAVTGATGFIGRFLVQSLVESGFQVRALARSACRGVDSYGYGDLADSPNWNDALSGVDAVIHCAAVAHQPLNEDPSLTDRIYRVNRDAVRSLADACVKQEVRRLIFLSSVKVYGESSPPGEPFRETDPPSPKDDYGLSKAQAEELLRGFAGSELEICALRLPLVYGPGNKANFRKLQKLATSSLPLPLASVRNRRSFLALVNLAAVIKALLDMKSWPFFELNVADQQAVSVSQLITYLAEANGERAWLFPCPVSLLLFIGRIIGAEGTIEKLTGDMEISVNLLKQAVPELRLLSTEQAVKSGTFPANSIEGRGF
ncbi:NAD-dependent epimerase/dehydratase family protein [Marinobacter pelagius]|uniref:NAD-dependent epimerase/dehydratase family protein n=1 Tax=Marinobacter sp. C7 TaxID=2951363 RepID=UPI001EF0A0D8|nr:NAD-dependent epimerase/dehydratase family protein [Marinobacter sp. C7]MCG7199133.1 NAD-dependent epimerase/dehydratase family protein [Marinobacter sp. C7]